MPAIQLWTIADLDTLPYDGVRYEILDGELIVNPPPGLPHQDAGGQLYMMLYQYYEAQGAGYAFVSPVGLPFDQRNYVEPDVIVSERREGKRPRELAPARTLLVVEVISPSSGSRDRGRKRRLYMEGGVAEYWIVDVAKGCIERWFPSSAAPEVLTESIEWRVKPDAEPFQLDLIAFFERMRDDA